MQPGGKSFLPFHDWPNSVNIHLRGFSHLRKAATKGEEEGPTCGHGYWQ
jgi:hypothetical protein